MIARDYIAAPHGWSRRTATTNRCRLVAFVEAMAAIRVFVPADVTLTRLDEWRTLRMITRSRVTINRDETAARQMFAWALQHERVAANPLAERKQLREPKRRPPPVIPSPREVKAVVAAALDLNERGVALTLGTALATGLRLDELRHLRPEHVHTAAVSVVPERGAAGEAWQGKNYKERSVPVRSSAGETAMEFATWRTSGYGGKGKAIGLADSWLAKRIDAACARAKVPSFRMHDLRRTFATECVRGGIPITTVREWLGHRDVSTTERYLGRYRDDAALVAPTPLALDVLTAPVADVLPMRRGRKRST